MDKNTKALKVFALREKGLNFIDIAKTIGGMSASEAGSLWVYAEESRKKYQAREKVVYRKRLNPIKPPPKPKKMTDQQIADMFTERGKITGWTVK